MKIIVGLGNPGEKYKGTRHNVGFMVVDKLSQIVDTDEVVLVKPETFMNRSGEAVRKVISDFRSQILDLYVVHDDLDIPLGKYKVQLGKGPKVHNGLRSIYAALKTKEFWHVRVGIDNRGSAGRTSRASSTGEEYVLGKFTKEEKPTIEKVIEEVAHGLRETVTRSHS